LGDEKPVLDVYHTVLAVLKVVKTFANHRENLSA